MIFEARTPLLHNPLVREGWEWSTQWPPASKRARFRPLTLAAYGLSGHFRSARG